MILEGGFHALEEEAAAEEAGERSRSESHERTLGGRLSAL